MIYEVAWTRALALVIGSSTYAFSAMLAAVLVGMAVAGYLVVGEADTARFAEGVKLNTSSPRLALSISTLLVSISAAFPRHAERCLARLLSRRSTASVAR